MSERPSDGPAEIEFDHHSPAYGAQWVDIYRDLRSRCPVARTDAHGGFFVVSRYDDVAAVARDDTTFSSLNDPASGRGGVTIPPARSQHVPIEMDPPEFLQYRRLLNPLFSPAASVRWRPSIERWAAVCVDEAIEKGAIDLVDDLAAAVPALFTCEFLGLPVEDWRRYAEPLHRIIYTPPGDGHTALLADLGWIHDSVQELIARRRVEPADDVITHLTQAEVGGQPLTDEVIGKICDLIMAGGFDTTTASAAAALHHLHRHRDDRQRLIDEPELLPSAVEEFLRFFSPTQALARTVAVPTEVAGVELVPGDRVLLAWASANHDETAFERPDEIVLDREPNRHLAFGVGAHRCLGSHVARAEITAMLRAVLTRIPDYEIDDAAAERYTTIGIVNGWITMPATFTPGQRRSPDHLPCW